MQIYNVRLDIPSLGETKIKNIKEALDKFQMEPVELFNLLIEEVKENPEESVSAVYFMKKLFNCDEIMVEDNFVKLT